MSDYLKGVSTIFTRDKANSVRPILKWVKDAAPRAREKVQASSILKKLEGIKEWKQVVLTKGEAELLGFIYSEFPEGAASEEGRQLHFLSSVSFDNPLMKGTFSLGPRGLVSPAVELKQKFSPVLKKELTEEEQEQRDSTLKAAKYQPKPDKFFEDKMQKEGQKE